jgi:crossover junction endodeoxyribonuclease RuvC
MRILGIDPGTICLGYGIIESIEDCVTLVDYGALHTKTRSPIGERLSFLYGKLMGIISGGNLDAVAVEQPFMGQNVRSALAIGRAQAIAILAAANCRIPSFEYTPTQIKQRVANYGASGKEQIQQMVMLQLGLSEVPSPSDAADALAVALCHLQQVHANSLLEERD